MNRALCFAMYGIATAWLLGGCSRVEPEPTPHPTSSDQEDSAKTDAATPGAPQGSKELAVPRAPAGASAELAARARALCAQARAEDKPLLVEFGAGWCGDCRLLARMSQEEPLRSELDRWIVLPVDITDPEPHEALTTAWGVRAIARWFVVEPKDCRAPLESWPRQGDRVVEPTRAGTAMPGDLVAWLAAARSSDER